MQGELEGIEGVAEVPETQSLRELYATRLRSQTPNDKLDRQLVKEVMEWAKRVIAHPTRPTFSHVENYSQYPEAEIALEESLEENIFLDDSNQLRVEVRDEKSFSCVAMLDVSSSMSGDKHLIASVAVAVMLLEIPARDNSLVVFSSDAKTIKGLTQAESPGETILRFLKTKPRGFTNIHSGLAEGLKQYSQKGTRKRKVGLLLSDGRATEGKDPLDLAQNFDLLAVLHLHGPGSHLESSQALANRGKGICLEVEEFSELPRRIYDAIRMISRL